MIVEQGSGIRALLRDYREFAGARLWLALGLMLLGAIAEGIGILMLVPLMAVAIGARDLPGSLGGIADLAYSFGPDQRLAAALVLFVAAMAVRSALTYFRDLELARLQSGYEAWLRLRSAATLAGLGWAFAGRVGQAGMQSLLLSDVPRASNAVAYAQRLAVALVVLVVQLVLAAFLSLSLTGVAMAVLLGGLAVAGRWAAGGVKSGLAIIARSEKSASSGFRLHAGLKAALAQGTVPQFLAEYRSTLADTSSEVVRFESDVAASRSVAFLGSALAAALLFFVGYALLALPFPVLVTSLVLFARMASPAVQILQSAHNVAAFAPSFAAIESRLGKLDSAVADEVGPEPLDWNELRLRDVTYEHWPQLGLTNLTFEMKSGQWIGVSGPSGAGKTTLVDLVAGLLAPQAGAVEVDGCPLEDGTLSRWRSGLAYVGQEGSMFDDSVRGNLTSDSREASDDDLWQALETVGLADRIRSLSHGLDERVGDRGSALSGGERQRLAIARGLLRKPSLLILDEATSALDLDSERALLAQLRSLNPRPAALIVAHRPSTLAHCDSVISIQHGERADAAD